jgi:ABC-type dipeptide/oligopeptide/nickel transport system ATPase subunit
MDLMYFSHSLKLVEKLCEQMKVHDMAQKVAKYLNEKETKEIFMNQVT